MGLLLDSAVQSNRKHERSRLRHVEEVVALHQRVCSRKIGLRVHARVLRPRVQVATRNPEICAAESGTAYERAGERIRHRYLTQLGVRAILHERLADSGVDAAKSSVPRLADLNRRTLARSHGCSGHEVHTEGAGDITLFGYLGRPEVVECTERHVRDHATLLVI